MHFFVQSVLLVLRLVCWLETFLKRWSTADRTKSGPWRGRFIFRQDSCLAVSNIHFLSDTRNRTIFADMSGTVGSLCCCVGFCSEVGTECVDCFMKLPLSESTAVSLCILPLIDWKQRLLTFKSPPAKYHCFVLIRDEVNDINRENTWYWMNLFFYHVWRG